MNTEGLAESLRASINNGSALVQWHLDYLEKMVAIDSRSFNVNEFAGDRKTPTDMQEILQLTREYLEAIGFVNIKINQPPPGPERSTPIIMAELIAGKDKPTLLMYAHLDKQPYIDDEKFRKWAGVVDEGNPGYGKISAKIFVRADADESVLREIWKLTVDVSPVTQTIRHGNEVETDFESID